MGKNNNDIESIDNMLSILDRVKDTLELIKEGKTSIKEACRLNGISYNIFRRVVFNTDWEVKDEDKREDFKKHFENVIPLYHWTEILFCDVMGLPRTPNSVEKMPPDVRETMEKAVGTLTEREERIVRLIYEECLNKEEVAEVIGRTPERVRQIMAKAMRKLKHPSRHGYIVFGDGYYCKKRGAYDEVYKSKIIEARTHEIAKLDLVIENKKKKIIDSNSTPRGFFGNDEITELDLSVRSFNCLWRAGIHTIEDLCGLTEEQLFHIKNLGRKSFDEILDKMKSYGLKLSDSESPMKL